MTAGVRLPLAIFAAMGLLLLTATVPARVAACTCGPPSSLADVAFVGTVTDGPIHWYLGHDTGTYTFRVHSVEHGDPGDGRVWTPQPGGGCGSTFDLGATYRVLADAVDPGAPYRHPADLVPGAPLVTHICIGNNALISEASPLTIAQVLVMNPVRLAGVLLALTALAGVAMWVWKRRKRPVTDNG